MKSLRTLKSVSLKEELEIANSKFVPNRELLGKLEEVIERLLPGDFKDWEEMHSSWAGGVKTFDATQRDPRTRASAWSIFLAHDRGEEAFGIADQTKDIEALNELEQALALGLIALRNMSSRALFSLGRASIDKMSDIVQVPANYMYISCAAAMQDGIEVARKAADQIGNPSSGENMRMAAVVGECREVYTARTGKRAPKTARDEPTNNPKFVQFVRAIFKALNSNFRVDSALRIWRAHDDGYQTAAKPSAS